MSPHRLTITRNWFQNTFDSLYPLIYAHRTVEAARPETDFSIAETQLKQGEAVLDLCCGAGRHMAHLKNVSDCVTGLDFSTHLLELARETLGPKSCIVRGDMRALPFIESFDVIMNYFTSFGYFHTREENLRVVKGIARALKPGGRFFIDYLNREWTEANLEEQSSRVIDEFDITERRWIDYEKHRINKATRVSVGGDEINHVGESVQLYTQDEFKNLLVEGGLLPEAFYGDYEGNRMSATRPRMIVVGGKA